MFFIIYKTTNTIDGKYYIGKHQTNKLNDGYIGSGKLLKRAIKKHGIENFHKEILYFCKDEKHMIALEKILVVPDKETNYNLCEGGKGGFSFINSTIWSNEKRKHHNISVTPFVKGHKHSSQTKERIRKSKIGNKNFLGKSLTDEHKNNISKAKKGIPVRGGHKRVGKNNGSYGTCWITRNGVNKKIKKQDIDIWLCQGYTLGRNVKHI
jgi:group I intron endonuclease